MSMELIPVSTPTPTGDGLQAFAGYNPTNGTIQMRDQDTGQLYTLGLAPTDVHIDSALATYCAGYNQGDVALADQICPAVPVPRMSDYFYTWDPKDAFEYVDRMEMAAGALNGVPEISPRLSSTQFATKCFAIAGVVPVELQANADAPLNVQMKATSRAMNAHILRRELNVKTLLDTSSNWTGGYSQAVTAKWNGGAGGDPIDDINAMIEAAPVEPNYLVMSRTTYRYFVKHPAVQKFIVKGDLSSSLLERPSSAGKLAALLELPTILVGKMKYRSAAATYSYIWGTSTIGIYQEPGVPTDGERVTTCKNFRWTAADVSPDGSSVGGYYVRRYFDPKRGPRGAWVVVVVVNEIPTMTSVLCGGRITGCTA